MTALHLITGVLCIAVSTVDNPMWMRLAFLLAGGWQLYKFSMEVTGGG